MRILLAFTISLSFAFGAWLADENMEHPESSDMHKRIAQYLQNCENGSAGDCYFVAHEYMKGEDDLQWYAEAAYYYQLACNGGVLKGCSNLGVLYENGLGVKQDYATSARLYSYACSYAEPDVCYN